MVEFKLTGMDRAIERMRKLPADLRKKPGRSALGKAARVITKAAKANALRVDDRETGRQIAQNVVQRFRSRYFRATGDLMVSVGVVTERGRIPKGNPDTGAKGNTPHWHLLELGTEEMAAQPFLRPAMEQNMTAAIATFGNALSRQLEKLGADP